jgi:hypothetical protein
MRRYQVSLLKVIGQVLKGHLSDFNRLPALIIKLTDQLLD